ncbi:transporter substrate-binding domain-containing protein [Tianweitania sp.]|uniref:transporter substrate-binding domain-containing protein n=1 Tax=Tianweitania sp. TaxID=2021634 RepID=UPI002896463C|nr:transporter substrate-binding domain-containing protein [Tianweitania sp.]
MIKMLASVLAGAIALMPVASYADTCSNDGLKRIESRGKLVVGVKADYKPFGYRDENGKIVGYEIDMAQKVADTLGVGLELVPVIASNRMQFLQQGQIDLMIATMTDTPDRRAIVGIVGPNYYASGTTALVPKALKVTKWDDLRDKPVCGNQGSFYLQTIEQKYGAKILAFGNAAEAKQALRDKKCVAFVYDDTSIRADFEAGGWDDFEIPLQSEDFTPWGMAVAKADEKCALGELVSGLQYNWHRDGWLIDLEKKWNMHPSPYLVQMREKLADPQAK